MNKKIFTYLIVLMGISILGIIIVQLVWMNNALRVKNELFNRGVNEALTNTVKKLEDHHNFGVINQMAFSDTVHWTHNMEDDMEFNLEHTLELHELAEIEPPHEPVVHKRPPRPIKIIRKTKPNEDHTLIELRVEADPNSEASSNSFSYQIRTDASRAGQPIILEKNKSSDSNIIVISNDTLIYNTDSLYSISMIKIDSLLMNLDTLNYTFPDISRRAKKKARNLKNIANQIVTEIYEWDVKEVDEVLLNEVLKKELNNKNIPIDFEFGIARDNIWDFPVAISDSIKLTNSEFQIPLYPNDIIQKNIKLALFFPNRDSFIYRSLNWLLMASFFFSLFILVTFSLSIYYILRQKKISEMKSDFINNMTHEFKTPIATISVASDSITNEKVVGNPERIRYFAGMIKKENARMNRQVEDILTIARLDRKDFEFNWETINVHDLINDAIQGINLQVEKRGGKIDANLKAVNPMVTTDRMHYTNVIYNLLDNAIKYSLESPDITISTINRTNGVVVSVEDKGIGMTKNVQGKIFERFYRQASGNIHNVKGFGLGLSYVNAVLEANHGTISVQSEPEKGSKFEVFLPFVRK
jgi:two-component system phosphate regulon sensor histidine kinase PhoR